MKFIKFLGESTLKPDLVGGKGVSLNDMAMAGISVPSSVILTKDAFEYFLSENNIGKIIFEKLRDIDRKKINEIVLISKEIQALILSSNVPNKIAEEINSASSFLKVDSFAIRSSATSEDSVLFSWAGQFESFLYVKKKNILTSVKKCWASLYCQRAIMYRIENNLLGENISMAVVIQEMLDGEKSGIIFSANPVTGDRNEIVIESGLGIGESVALGKTTPKLVSVSRKNLAKNEYNNLFSNEKKQAEINKCCYDNSNKGSMNAELSHNEVKALVEIVADIEKIYDSPRDIEWVKYEGSFFVVQNRPITTSLSDVKNKRKKTIKFEEKFVSIFESEGFSPFGAYLNYKAGYNEHGGIIFCQNSDKVGLWISEKDLNSYELEGMKIYESEEKIKRIFEDVNILLKKINVEEILSKKNFLEEVENEKLLEYFDNFTDISIKLISLYKYTEEHYLGLVEKKIASSMNHGNNLYKMST